jgi:hypothetical protein
MVRRGLSGLTCLMSLFAFLAVVSPAGATVEKKGEWPAEDKKITLNIDHTSQANAIKQLAEAAGWSVLVRGNGGEIAELHVKDQPADKVLALILADGNWSAQRDGTLIAISQNSDAKALAEAAVAAVPPVPPVPPPVVAPVMPDVKVHVEVDDDSDADDEKDSHKNMGKDREVVGQNLVIEKDEVIRNVHLVGGSLVIKGTVTGDIELVGGKVDLEPGSRVAGNIQVMGGSVHAKKGARIEDNTDIVGGHFDREEGATVAGNVSTRIEGDDDKASMGTRMAREIGECTTAGAFLFALGAVLIALFTKRSETIKVEFAARPMRMFALGIAGLLGSIVVLGALCVTVIGIPFAAIGLLLGIFGIFAAMTSVLEVVGRAFIGHKTKNEYAHLALGCGLFAVTMMIPVVDDIAKFVLVLVSIGSLVATRGAGLIPPRKNAQPAIDDSHPYRSAEAV